MRSIRIIPLFAFAFLLLFLSGCSQKADSPVTSLDQLNEPGRVIGVGVNCPEEALLAEDFPEASIISYSDSHFAYEEVARGRLDAFVYARLPMEHAIENGMKGVRLLDGNYSRNVIAVGISPISPIPDLIEKVNRFLAENRDNGTLDDMYQRWVLDGDDVMPKIPKPKNPALHLPVGTAGTSDPYTYYVGTELRGYDIELAYRFASWLNADLDFLVYDYNGIISAGQGGDVDCIMSNLYYSPERDEIIDFSDPVRETDIAVMVRDPGSLFSDTGDPSQGTLPFWESMGEGFQKTFVRESRWRLFLQGIGTTFFITIMSVLFGTILGFLLFMLCRKGNPVANILTSLSVRLVQGLPVVVLLMILYYVVFGTVFISGTIVAIIGFTMVFAASVFRMVKAGVQAVDPGQLEAAYTLGYTNRRAFYRIILPQALPHFMPQYKAEISSLVKATAVVGYIAVQDLTKMADVVRSRTYEAFFSLIAVALIYFLMAGLLKLLVRLAEHCLDPRKRSPKAIRKRLER